MEDVDRLFECFKCGISPPQSAVRERKRSKGRMKRQGISIHEASPGSAEQPKKKIFDLEFSRRHNAERNGDEMVDLLISVILEALFEKYSIQGNRDWVVELDSSTAEKFSRHLIIRIPKTAFEDNTHAGAFVSEICSRIHSARGKDERFENMFVRKDSSSAEPPCQLFIDAAVYSRNRCFRLALSSKAGKNSVLLPTERFKCKDMCEEDMSMSSLICSMDVDCNKLLVCKMDMECMKTLQFDTEVNNDYRRHCTPKEVPLNGVPSDTGNSPFPALDKFIDSIASIGNISGGAIFKIYFLRTLSSRFG
ncbi:hypothetical protein OIU77_001253 [Salix suchowensis]|uniref:DNA-directed primase/polymerase protein n=1 Tax=Salix suchowensis TaxID=1278906 RepID=A0ABQ9B2Y4_9ROSI|nr:hypothetical protein OIU77_001253 [Salix suchowensis]